MSNISCRNHISEPLHLYEIDLVKQWLKLLPGTVLKTENFGKITIINTGILNRHEGPDIKDAILVINDKVVRGPIECHISTVDWYRHEHQKNSEYQSVILHVVRKLNKGNIAPSIPTLVLNTIDANQNNCSLNNINKGKYLFEIIVHHSQKRWLAKINIYNGYHNNLNQLVKLLIRSSFRILGAGGNEKQFVKLSNNISYSKVQQFNFQEFKKYFLETEKQLAIIWVKRGIRPAQQPRNRMKLAAELVYYFNNLDFSKLPNLNNIVNSIVKECPSASGAGIQSELLGNVFIPFYAARALYFKRTVDYQNYYEYWNNLKIPNIYRKFEKRFGKIISSKQLKSYSTLQGLIEINRNWCIKNMCHLCPLKKQNYVNSK